MKAKLSYCARRSERHSVELRVQYAVQCNAVQCSAELNEVVVVGRMVDVRKEWSSEKANDARFVSRGSCHYDTLQFDLLYIVLCCHWSIY